VDGRRWSSLGSKNVEFSPSHNSFFSLFFERGVKEGRKEGRGERREREVWVI